MALWIAITAWAIGVAWAWPGMARTLIHRFNDYPGQAPAGVDYVLGVVLGLWWALIWPLSLLVMWGANWPHPNPPENQ